MRERRRRQRQRREREQGDEGASSSSGLLRDRRPAGREVRVDPERLPEGGAGGGGAAETALDHAAVEELRARRAFRAGAPAASGRAPPRSVRCGRGAQARTSSASMLRRSAYASRARERASARLTPRSRSTSAVSSSVRAPFASKQPLHHVDEPIGLGRLGVAPCCGERLTEPGGVLGQRHGFEGTPVEARPPRRVRPRAAATRRERGRARW